MGTKIKMLIGDKKLLQTKGLGADIMEGGERNLAVMIPLAKSIGFNTYFYNLLSGIKNDANAALVNYFLKETGAKLGIFIPIAKAVAPDYLDWVVTTFGHVIDFIQLDQESISTPSGMTNTQYIERSRAVMARYPQFAYSWDLGLFTRYPNKEQVERNVQLAKQVVPPIQGRQYAQLADVLRFTSNQQGNLDLIKTYPTLASGYLAEFKKMGNLKQQNITQWFNENAGTILLSGAVSNIAIGEFLRFVYENTEWFARIYWMQAAGLMSNGIATREYTSIKRFMPATKWLYTVPLDIKLAGVTGIAFHDGVDSFGLFTNNLTATEHTLTANEIKIFQKNITGIIVRDSGYARDLTSQTTNEVVADIQTKIKPYSTNYITFKTSAVIGES